MAEGYERRQETQSLAAPQIRPATVRGPGVGMPGGSAPQVDPTINLALGELARFGSGGMQQLIERKRKENYLEGQAMYAQGKTLVDLDESGGNYYHKQGWQTMEAQNAGALWAVAQEQKIDEADYTLEPEEYRKGMAKSIADLTKDRDPQSSAMVMEIANKYLPGLASKQMSKNIEFRKTKTMNAAKDSVAVMSAADIDKPDFLATLSREGNSTLSKLNDQDYNEVLVGGILKAYEGDNPNAHKWAEEAGMLQNLQAGDLATLRQAQSNWQARREQKYNEQYTLDSAEIASGITAGKYSLQQALDKKKALNEKNGYRFDAQDAGQIANLVISEQERKKREAEAEAKANARQLEAESKAQQYAMAFQEFSIWNMGQQQLLTSGQITNRQYIDQANAKIFEMGIPFTSGIAQSFVGDVVQANQNKAVLQANQIAFQQANSTGDYTGLSSGEVQDAIDLKRYEIFNGAQDAIAEGRGGPDAEQRILRDANAKWQNFLERSGQVDNKTKAVFNTFLSGPLIDSKGEVPANAEIAFAQFMEMYNSNPQLAMKHISGDDARARVRMMIDNYQEPGNYGGALASVALIESNARQYGTDPTKFLENPVHATTINEKVDEYISDNTLGVADIIPLWGNATFKQYFAQNDESLTRAENGAKGWMPTAIKNQAVLLKSRNPALDDQSAIEQASDIVGRNTVYMGGAFVYTPNYNVYEKLFKDGAGKYGVDPAIPNDALYAYLNKYGNDMWKEDLFGPSLPDPELSIVPDPTGTGLLIQVKRPQSALDEAVGRTETWTSQMPVPFRRMGIEWESQHIEALEQPKKLRGAGGAQLTPKQRQQNIDKSMNFIKDTLGIE